MSLRRFIKYALLLLGCIGFLLIGLAVYTNVSTRLTVADIAAFEQMGLQHSARPLTYAQQIALIRQVQTEVFRWAPLGAGIPPDTEREPADLLRIGHGLCYDRSRTLDKALAYLGFETRHVYLLYQEQKSFLPALFHYRQPSHAVTEVKTARGWLLVDSNTPWISVNREGMPIAASQVWQRFSEFEQAPRYMAGAYWAIPGMYSRRGRFYAPYIFFPEFNWPDFLRWLFRG